LTIHIEDLPLHDDASPPDDAPPASEPPPSYPTGPTAPSSETVPRVDEDRYASPPDDATSDDDHHEATGAASAPANPLSLAARRESVLAHLRRRRDGVDRAIETPWPDLNNQLGGGWWPGVHVLIAGTGAGKSQLVIEAGTDAAAEDRAAVGYVALELDDVGMLSRIASRLAALDNKSLPWSDISRGDIDPDGDDMVRAWQRLDRLPFHLDTGSGHGWSVDNLKTMADGLRAAYPGRPLLLVVDFLQLVGGDGRDMRERIGRAAYSARQIARDYQAAIVLISSTARQNYNLFGDGGFTTAGIQLDGGRRAILSPDVLVGLGKETGEIEYAADSVTVMGRIPRDRIPADPGGFSPVLLATAKLRAGPPSWCVLDSNGQTFRAWNVERTVEVVEALQTKGKKGSDAAAPSMASTSAGDGKRSGRKRSEPPAKIDDDDLFEGIDR